VIVLGFDLAANSGWAVRDSTRHRSSIECGVISAGEYKWEARYAILSNLAYPIIKRYKPDFVAIERPERGVRQFKKKPIKGRVDLGGNDDSQPMSINPNALQLTGIAGGIVTICMLMSIPCGTIAANSWHPIYFGKGWKPADGDWKQASIEAAEREGIQLPSTKKDKKDAADAIAVCTCWHKCDVLEIEWMQKRFLDLRTGAYDQKRSAA
jgi:Holliday junction resolvasome RuvABC endonuclease subunit